MNSIRESNASTEKDEKKCCMLDGLLLTEERYIELLAKGIIDLKVVELTKVDSIRIGLLHKRCMRCGSHDDEDFASFYCFRCKKTDVYCRNCISYGRVLGCTPLYVLKDKSKQVQQAVCFSFPFTLTPYQKQASERIIQSIKTKEKTLLIHAVCGAGKTEMLFHGIKYAREQGLTVCISCPRKDVILELAPRFKRVFPDEVINCQYGGSAEKDCYSAFTLCTTHQLIHYQSRFDCLIIDEVDAFPFHNDPHLITHAARAVKKDGSTIYLSATPRQSLINQKVPTIFIPKRFHNHPLPVPSVQYVNFNKRACPPKVVEAMMKRKVKRQLLVFVPTIKGSEKVKELLTHFFPNQAIEAVHSEDPKRKEKIDQFRQQQLHVMVTTTILERGVTFPSVDVFILEAHHHVFDEAALTQIAGRAGRSKDDPDGAVIYFHQGITQAIKQSVMSIQKMNKRAGFF